MSFPPAKGAPMTKHHPPGKVITRRVYVRPKRSNL
jgi:hypothetical protein